MKIYLPPGSNRGLRLFVIALYALTAVSCVAGYLLSAVPNPLPRWGRARVGAPPP